jgi:hypothetical protein
MGFFGVKQLTKVIYLTFLNLVTPEAGAKHERLLNEWATDSLQWLLFICPYLVVILKSDLNVQQTLHYSGFVKHLSLT